GAGRPWAGGRRTPRRSIPGRAARGCARGPRARRTRRATAPTAARRRPSRASSTSRRSRTSGIPWAGSADPDVLEVVVAERVDQESVQLARVRVAEGRVVEEALEGVLGGELLDLV